MRNVMQGSPEEVVEGHYSSLTEGLPIASIPNLNRIHGLNKLEGEVKVRQRYVHCNHHLLPSAYV